MSSPQASILAIGTELTTGQITNRNAAWLSDKLVELGFEVVLHETVADHRSMILSALDRCRSVSGWIFVTGGLGPTTDDFTREVIADWLGRPLVFHEPSWTKITERLTRLGIPVAESNRQQCFYPDGAEVIPNPQGTADAFFAQVQGTESVANSARIWVLPGPPAEVAAVWESSIQATLRKLAPPSTPLQLLSWQCIGKSEAELGEITELALKGSSLLTGYRAHRPYVEVKVWCAAKDIRIKQSWLLALEKALSPWVATRQGEDLVTKFLALLTRAEKIQIVDSSTGGVLSERVGTWLREPPYVKQASGITLVTEWSVPPLPGDWVQNQLANADAEKLTLVIAGITPAGEWALGVREGDSFQSEVLHSPYHTIELLDRSRRYVAEMALKRWSEWLKASLARY